MTTNHTAGPWAHDDHEIYSEQTDHGAAICTMNTTSAHFTKDEAEANARLIAAAPELLAALIQAYSFMVTNKEYQGREILNTIQNAIQTAVK